MPKLKVNSNELQGTDVQFVSLVKRGANRIPFRIVKEDTEPMLDLGSIGRKFFQKAEPTPGVLAVMVNKDAANLDAIKEQLKAAGLSVEKSEEKDGIIFFKQEGQAEFDTGVVKVNDDIGMVVSGVKKAFCGWDFDSTSFGEVHKVSSFYPSMRHGADIFSDTVSNIMQKADTPAEAADMIGNAVDEFKTYITALAKGLPERAFKSEVALLKESISASPTHGTKTTTVPPIKGATDNNIDGDPTHGNETPEIGKDGGKKKLPVQGTTSNDVEGSPAVLKEEDDAIAAAEAALEAAKAKKAEKEAELAKGGDKKPKEMTDEEKKAKAKKEEEDAAAAAAAAAKPAETQKSDEQPDLLKQLGALLDTKLADVTKTFEGSVEALKSEFATVQVAVGKLDEKVKKTEEAVNGTVHNDEPDDTRSGVRKSDRSFKSVPPLLDTAFEAA